MTNLSSMIREESDPRFMWCVGLFEGEGCITLLKSCKKDRKKEVTHYYLSLELSMTDQDIVERFAEWIGEGRVTRKYPPSYSGPGHQVQWRWRITGKRAEQVTIAMLPLLSKRRNVQYADCMAQIMLRQWANEN